MAHIPKTHEGGALAGAFKRFQYSYLELIEAFSEDAVGAGE
jgi:hypothetical protein